MRTFVKIVLAMTFFQQALFWGKLPCGSVFAFHGEVREESTTGEEKQVDEDISYDEIYSLLKLDEASNELEGKGVLKNISFKELVSAISKGDFKAVASALLNGMSNLLVGELRENKALMLQVITIVLIGSIFVNISNSFGNGFISENGFYVTYLIITSVILTAFSISLDMVAEAINYILWLIRVIVPVFALSMSFGGYTATGAGMYSIILTGIWLVQVVIIRFVLPMIKFYVIISMINNLNREESFSKLCALIKGLVGWLLKTVVVFIAGMNIIKSLIEPQIDALGKNSVNRIIQSMPGGGIVSVLTGTFLGAGLIIKNSIGLAGIILLALVILTPVIKTLILMLTVKITGALIQPIGEKRYVEGVEALANGMGLLLQAMGSSAVLFMLTLAIMSYASK